MAPATKDEELAEFVNNSFRGGISDDKQAKLLKNICCELRTTRPKTNSAHANSANANSAQIHKTTWPLYTEGKKLSNIL